LAYGIGETYWKAAISNTTMRVMDSMEVALREVGCEDGKWLERTYGRVQWLKFVFVH
jgi:hypothetical protein